MAYLSRIFYYPCIRLKAEDEAAVATLLIYAYVKYNVLVGKQPFAGTIYVDKTGFRFCRLSAG